MDLQTKVKLKNEISVLKGLVPAAVALTGSMQQAAYPIAGPVVTIPALPMAAQAIKAQNDCLLRIVNLLEKMIDES